MHDFTAWIALSATGYPAPQVGLAFTRTQLQQRYAETFHHDIKVAGYRLVKVRISEIARASIKPRRGPR